MKCPPLILFSCLFSKEPDSLTFLCGGRTTTNPYDSPLNRLTLDKLAGETICKSSVKSPGYTKGSLRYYFIIIEYARSWDSSSTGRCL